MKEISQEEAQRFAEKVAELLNGLSDYELGIVAALLETAIAYRKDH